MAVCYIKCFNNGKFYIGITKDYNKRMRQHISDMSKNIQVVHRAMNKHTHITLVLAELDDYDLIKVIEHEAIKVFKECGKILYNKTEGFYDTKMMRGNIGKGSIEPLNNVDDCFFEIFAPHTSLAGYALGLYRLVNKYTNKLMKNKMVSISRWADLYHSLGITNTKTQTKFKKLCMESNLIVKHNDELYMNPYIIKKIKNPCRKARKLFKD